VRKPQGYRQAAAEECVCLLMLCLPYYQALLFAGISGMISVLLLTCLLLCVATLYWVAQTFGFRCPRRSSLKNQVLLLLSNAPRPSFPNPSGSPSMVPFRGPCVRLSFNCFWARVPEGRGVLCPKFSIPIFRTHMVVVSLSNPYWLSPCWGL
jgi:hypothetical protein